MAFILPRSFVPSILQGNPVLAHSFYAPNSLVTSYNLTKIKQQQEAQHRRREEVLGELVQSFYFINTCLTLRAHGCLQGQLWTESDASDGINSSILSSSNTTLAKVASTMAR